MKYSQQRSNNTLKHENESSHSQLLAIVIFAEPVAEEKLPDEFTC